MFQRYVFTLWLIAFVFINLSDAMTKSQVKQAGKLMRNVCQPKNKVTTEQIDNIKNGEILDDKNVKCYISCVFTMAQTVKNGKLDYESSIKQIDLMFPDNMKEGAKKSLTECKPIMDDSKELCQASYELAKCLYKANPDLFLFP